MFILYTALEPDAWKQGCSYLLKLGQWYLITPKLDPHCKFK